MCVCVGSRELGWGGGFSQQAAFREIKTGKISSGGSGGISVKFYTSKNFMLFVCGMYLMLRHLATNISGTISRYSGPDI